jgi:hypothetical protein
VPFLQKEGIGEVLMLVNGNKKRREKKNVKKNKDNNAHPPCVQRTFVNKWYHRTKISHTLFMASHFLGNYFANVPKTYLNDHIDAFNLGF